MGGMANGLTSAPLFVPAKLLADESFGHLRLGAGGLFVGGLLQYAGLNPALKFAAWYASQVSRAKTAVSSSSAFDV